MRTLVLLLAAIGTVVEAAVFGGVLYVLGAVIGAYSMSMDGMPAARGQLAVWIIAAVLALVLAAPAVPLVAAAIRGRPFGRPARGLIIGVLVLDAILGIVVELISGELAFVGVLAVFTVLLLALLADSAPRSRQAGPVPVA
ncbi:MAG: hypothetical protein JWP76_133 [Dactylosporangium sp.]|nr:hypothetical protein [Dactylosporangium sp.]